MPTSKKSTLSLAAIAFIASFAPPVFADNGNAGPVVIGQTEIVNDQTAGDKFAAFLGWCWG